MTKRLPPELRKQPNRTSSPIVAVAPSGNVAGYFDNPGQAIKLAGVNSGNLYQCLLHKKKTASGFMWYYKEEHQQIFITNPDALKWEKSPSHSYIKRGGKKGGIGCTKGMKLNLSPEALEQRRSALAKAHQIMREKGIYKLRGQKRRIPVLCVETGRRYNSMSECADLIGVNLTTLFNAIRHNYRCKGLHYIKLPKNEGS